MVSQEGTNQRSSIRRHFFSQDEESPPGARMRGEERQRRRIAQFLSERLIWENVCPFLFSFSVASRRRETDKWRLYSIAHRKREGRGNSDMGLVAGKKQKKCKNNFKNGWKNWQNWENGIFFTRSIIELENIFFKNRLISVSHVCSNEKEEETDLA